jgi:hypothetical protein
MRADVISRFRLSLKRAALLHVVHGEEDLATVELNWSKALEEAEVNLPHPTVVLPLDRSASADAAAEGGGPEKDWNRSFATEIFRLGIWAREVSDRTRRRSKAMAEALQDWYAGDARVFWIEGVIADARELLLYATVNQDVRFAQLHSGNEPESLEQFAVWALERLGSTNPTSSDATLSIVRSLIERRDFVPVSASLDMPLSDLAGQDGRAILLAEGNGEAVIGNLTYEKFSIPS